LEEIDMSSREEDEELFIKVITWIFFPITWPLGWLFDKLKEKQ
jgi:hypothetical protein